VGKLCAFFQGVVGFVGDVVDGEDEGREDSMVLDRAGWRNLGSVGEIGKDVEWERGRMSSLLEDVRDKSEWVDRASMGVFKSIKSGSSMIWPVRKASFRSIGSLAGDCPFGVVGALFVLPDILRRISILFCFTTPGVFEGRGGNPHI
jgi:hypothetical protein